MFKKFNVSEVKTKTKYVATCNSCLKTSDEDNLTIYDFYIVDKGTYQTIFCNKCTEESGLTIIKPYKIKKESKNKKNIK